MSNPSERAIGGRSTPPHPPGAKGDKSYQIPSLSMRKNTMIISIAALPPTWPSIGSNWNWLSKPWNLPTRFMKKLRQMMIHRLKSISRFKTNALNGWGAGGGSASCEPSWKDLAWTSNRHKHIGVCHPPLKVYLQDLQTWSQWVQPYTEQVLRKHQRLLEEEANQLWIIINEVQPVTGDEGHHVLRKENLHGWQKYGRSTDPLQEDQKWPWNPVSEPSTKKSKMGNDPIQGPHGEKGAWWKKSVPRKGSGPSEDVNRR